MKSANEWLGQCPEELDGDIMNQVVGGERFRKVYPTYFIEQIQADALEHAAKVVDDLNMSAGSNTWLRVGVEKSHKAIIDTLKKMKEQNK